MLILSIDADKDLCSYPWNLQKLCTCSRTGQSLTKTSDNLSDIKWPLQWWSRSRVLRGGYDSQLLQGRSFDPRNNSEELTMLKDKKFRADHHQNLASTDISHVWHCVCMSRRPHCSLAPTFHGLPDLAWTPSQERLYSAIS